MCSESKANSAAHHGLKPERLELLRKRIHKIKSSWLGRLLFYGIRFRRQVVLDNLKRVFGDALSDQEQRHLAILFYGHLMRTFFENIAHSWMNEDQIRARVRLEGVEHLLGAVDQGKGILLLTGHFGNWEIAPMGGIAHFPQFKGRLHILRRQIVNKVIEKILFRRFYAIGLDIIPKRSSLGRVMDSLSKNDTVAFIMDQYARPGREGILVPFFGQEAGTFKSLAMVARSSESPVLPTVSWREPTGQHVMRFLKPLRWIEHEDADQEVYLNTQQYNHILEGFVLDHPEQWLWLHKRWKIKQPQKRRRPVEKS